VEVDVSFINEQENKIPQLLKQAKVSPFAYFIYIIIVATVGAAYFVRGMSPDIEWNDWGVALIIGTAAGACYAFIWLYIKRITKVSVE
jgi:hypothetical protein